MQFTAKTVDEAIAQGLKELNITEEDAKITVIQQPIKGLFGKIKCSAIVEVEKIKKECESNNVVEFVEKIIEFMGLDASTELIEKEDSTVINLTAIDSASVIGYRGEVLDAIQTLAGACLNIGRKEYKKVVVDCENYREKRENTLINLAKKLEEKATAIRREVILEPMSPYERRIIHTALANSETCTTKSEGNEPNRYVVIVPFDKDEYAKPYNAGRNKSDKGGKGGKRDGFKKGRSNKNNRNGRGNSRNTTGEVKRKTSSIFGTYLGNSLKDK